MALSYGTKPTVYTDSLTGMASEIYTQRTTQGIYLGETQIEVTIGSTTYTETIANRNARVLANKLESWSDAKAIVDNLQSDAEITNIPSVVKNSIDAGAVAPNDGGATLKTTVSASLAGNAGTGGIS